MIRQIGLLAALTGILLTGTCVFSTFPLPPEPDSFENTAILDMVTCTAPLGFGFAFAVIAAAAGK